MNSQLVFNRDPRQFSGENINDHHFTKDAETGGEPYVKTNTPKTKKQNKTNPLIYSLHYI